MMNDINKVINKYNNMEEEKVQKLMMKKFAKNCYQILNRH